jgi:type IV secretory pathway TrbL component
MSSDAKTAATALQAKTNAVAMHRNQVMKKTVPHFGQSLLMTTGAGSGCSDEH